MDTIIRDVREEDLNDVLILNEEVVPAVNSVPLETMQWFAAHAAYFRVAMIDERLGAFLVGMRPGIAYQSPNYQWFSKRYEDFGYIDRVAVAQHARRLGLGSAMYDDFRRSLPPAVEVMTCEIYTEPPATTSMRFHERYGFSQIDSQKTEGGKKEVALMAKSL
jgi:predicted GNAT superfamily acetyltransferase